MVLAVRTRERTPVEAFNQVVLRMFEAAVRTSDPSRDSLVLTVTNALMQTLAVAGIEQGKTQIEQQIEVQLDRMFQIMIEHDDFDLFRSALHDLTLTITRHVSQLASGLKSLLWKAVYEYKLDITKEENRKQIEALMFAVEYGGRRFERVLMIPVQFPDFGAATKNFDKDFLNELRSDSLSYYINSLLTRMFCLFFVNLLFRYSQRRIDAGKINSYLTELWHHTSPEDAGAIIVNVTPVPTDPLWLTLLYLFGGSDNPLWHDKFSFRDFHGIGKYVTQAYLLSLAKIGAPIPIPSDSKIQKLAELKLWNELDELYTFADAFLSETKTQDFLAELEKLPELKMDRFIERNRPSKPGRTWVEDLTEIVQNAQEHLLHAKKTIEAFQLLDDEKTNQCVSNVVEAYQKNSIIDLVASVRESTTKQELESLKSFQLRFPNAPKECFLKAANVDCSMIWNDLGQGVALSEEAHVYEVASGLDPEPVVIEKYDPDQILEAVEQAVARMAKKNMPNIAFVPLSLISDLMLRFKIKYDRGEILRLRNAELHIIHSWKGFPFRDIVIIDRNQCLWLCQKVDQGRIRVSISPSKTKPSEVSVEAEARGLFVPKPDGVRKIKVKELPELP